MTIESELDTIARRIASTPIPRASQSWGGADVVVSMQSPPQHRDASFHPPARYVVTPLALELSWLFESVRDVFYQKRMLDSCSKIEFFGRLANAANRYLSSRKMVSAPFLLAAVLREAYRIAVEIQDGTFEALTVSVGGEIAGDSAPTETADELDRGILRFFSARGINMA
jgi:hypothetical protein